MAGDGGRQLRPRPVNDKRSKSTSHRPSRPSRLLNTGTKNFQNRPAYVPRYSKLYAGLTSNSRITNATQSRLLLLPPELRTRIWHFVLGGNTLHIHWRTKWPPGKRDYYYDVCLSKHGDDDAALDIRNAPKAGPVTSYADRHALCELSKDPAEKESRRKLELAVLQVCSQIHQEAALIPFSDNVFSYHDCFAMEIFSKHLNPTQQKAISTVCMTNFARFVWIPPIKWTGLRHFYAFLRCDSGLADSIRSHSPEYDGNIPGISTQEDRRLSTATIAAYHEATADREAMSDPDLFNKLCQLLEERLTRPAS